MRLAEGRGPGSRRAPFGEGLSSGRRWGSPPTATVWSGHVGAALLGELADRLGRPGELDRWASITASPGWAPDGRALKRSGTLRFDRRRPRAPGGPGRRGARAGVGSSVADRSGSIAGDRERPADPVAEEREPSDGLVAEYEADVTIGDLAAPATHRGGGDLLPEQTVGDLDTVEPKRGHIEQQRPGSRRPH